MADEEPESQIVSSYLDYGDPISPPPIPTCMGTQKGGVGYSKTPIGDGNQESQLENLHNESYASRVEDTQFEPIEEATQLPDSNISRVYDTQFEQVENDTQAVDDANFSNTQRDSQAQGSINQQTPFTTSSITAPLLSRPDVGNIDDIGSGFTFGAFQKPAKGMFNRPPLNTSGCQPATEGSSIEGQTMSFSIRPEQIAAKAIGGDPAAS